MARAIEEQIQRADRLRDRTQETIARGVVLVDTEGAKVGQINGLSVLQLGSFAFGRPSRITARVRMGAGRVTDIEREVKLGGPLHSKGVMILWGFLAGRYAQDVPLALAATLVFEQSYGGVDGDSASAAELFALLSALAESPSSSRWPSPARSTSGARCRRSAASTRRSRASSTSAARAGSTSSRAC